MSEQSLTNGTHCFQARIIQRLSVQSSKAIGPYRVQKLLTRVVVADLQRLAASKQLTSLSMKKAIFGPSEFRYSRSKTPHWRCSRRSAAVGPLPSGPLHSV